MVKFPASSTKTFLLLPPNNGNSNLSLEGQCLSLLTAVCSSMKHLHQIHAHILTSGLHHDSFLFSEIIRFCSLSPSGSLSYARTLLNHHHHSSHPLSAASWNHVIRGCAATDSPEDAVTIFLQMHRSGTRPTKLTFPFLLKACAAISDLHLGRQVHADIVKSGNHSDVYVQNTLISLYGSSRKVSEARRVFDGMTLRTVVSWNAVLSACVESLWLEETVRLFGLMRTSGFEPDETTMVVLLSASAELGNLSLGRWLHSQMIGKGLVMNVRLGTALVNMYAKCGVVRSAELVFNVMPQRNVWTWSAMVLGFAQHGMATEALQLFLQMKNSSVDPNYVTFLGVLCACSHAGLVDSGYQFFRDMTSKYGIKPRMSHYSAMVDILGRSGRLEEAYCFIETMPVEPDPVVWRTLLSACNIHKSNDVGSAGERVRMKLLELEPRRCGNYVIVANMYAETGSWEEAAKVRKLMREEGLKKMAGESCIEVDGLIHRFISGDDSCVSREDIYVVLEELNLNTRMIDFVDSDILENSQIIYHLD